MNLHKSDDIFEWNGIPWVGSSVSAEPNTYTWFSRNFKISSPATSAPIALSAQKSYKLYVNGKFILMGPMREEKPYFYYDALDIASFLRTGENNISILVYSHSGDETQNGLSSGLIFQGKVITGKDVCELTPPESWKCTLSKTRNKASHKLGDSLGFSEDYDFSIDETAYHTGNFIGQKPIILGLHPLPPFISPLERDLPFFSGKTFSVSFFEQNKKGILGDFGKEVFGFVRLMFRTTKNAKFSIAYSELLTDGEVNFRKAGMDYRDKISSPPGTFTWTSYEKRAGRYAFIDNPEIEVISLDIQEYGYPYVRVKSKEDHKTDKLSKKILEISARTIELCSDDLLNDCPWRERTQYLDPYAYFTAMQKLFGTMKPVKKFLLQFARGAGSSIPMPMCYPAPPNTMVIPDFVMIYAVALKKYHDLSGDIETVGKCFDTSLKTIEYYCRFEDKDGLLKDVPGWIFLDNSFELCKKGKSCGLNAVYAGTIDALSELAGLLGKKEQSQILKHRFETIRKSFRETFIKNGNLLDSDLSPAFLEYDYFNYHYPADVGNWQGKSFLLKTKISFASTGKHCLNLSLFNRYRVFLDREIISEGSGNGDWATPPLFNSKAIELKADSGHHDLVIEVEHSAIDWEFFISAKEKITFNQTFVAGLDEFGTCNPKDSELSWKQTHLRPYYPPKRSQVSIALSALFGMLDSKEAVALLKGVLPDKYYANFKKKTTPYFVDITEDKELLKSNVLPCNTPWSMNFLCQALEKHGMRNDAQQLVSDIFAQQLEMGATSWWEEWGTESSLCHAWGAFAAEYM